MTLKLRMFFPGGCFVLLEASMAHGKMGLWDTIHLVDPRHAKGLLSRQTLHCIRYNERFYKAFRLISNVRPRIAAVRYNPETGTYVGLGHEFGRIVPPRC